MSAISQFARIAENISIINCNLAYTHIDHFTHRLTFSIECLLRYFIYIAHVQVGVHPKLINCVAAVPFFFSLASVSIYDILF